MAGGGGGAWKVAYADFVTAMMAFFLVMWIVAQNKPVREAVAGYFRDPMGTASGDKPGGQGFLPGNGAKAKSSSAKDNKRGGGRLPSLAVLREQNGTSIGAAISFPEESVELDAAAQQRLKELAPLLRGHPTKIEIRGHVNKSRVPGGPGQDVWKACYARSLATMKFLVDNGVEQERMRLSQAGPYEPSSPAKDAMSRRQNSRVEIYMLSEFADGRKKESEKTDGIEVKPDQDGKQTENEPAGK